MSKREPATSDSVENKFTKVPRYFIERGRYLTPPAKWVFVILKSFENNRTKRIFPSHSTIEELSGLSRSAVNKALKELEHFLWISKEKTSGRSTDYTLSYGAYYKAQELEEIVAPIPTKAAAKEYKDNLRKIRTKKEGSLKFRANKNSG